MNVQAPLHALGKRFLCFVDVCNPHYVTSCHCPELIWTVHKLACLPWNCIWTPTQFHKEMSAKHFSCCSAAKFLLFLLAGIKPLAACAVSPVAAFQTAAFWFPGGAAYPPSSAEQPEPWVALTLNQTCCPRNDWAVQWAQIFSTTTAEVQLAYCHCGCGTQWVWPCTPCTETEMDR